MGWGHAETTGIPNIDAYLSCRHFEPTNGQDYYSEKLIELDRINNFYDRPRDDFKTVTRSELGLSEEGRIYLCPQSAFKYHPDFDAALREILSRDQEGWVVLSEGTDPSWNELLLTRWKESIPNHSGRLKLLKRVEPDQFRGLISLADVMIDPIHFTGGHTIYMAFSVGTPVITWDGLQMSGRMTQGLYKQMGMNGPVAQSPEEFAELAVNIATNAERLRSISAEILEKSSALFCDLQAVREFENALMK